MKESLGFEVKMAVPYEEALELVKEALKAEAFGVLCQIDVKATLKEKLDADFRPYAILGACNPPLAHRALGHSAEIGLLLPCNVTVEADPAGGSIVRVVNPESLLGMAGMEADEVLVEVAAAASEKLRRVASALTAASSSKTL